VRRGRRAPCSVSLAPADEEDTDMTLNRSRDGYDKRTNAATERALAVRSQLRAGFGGTTGGSSTDIPITQQQPEPPVDKGPASPIIL
jgi:hypothetical protein